MILEISINTRASGDTVVCHTHYYTHSLHALEEATKLLLLITKGTVKSGYTQHV